MKPIQFITYRDTVWYNVADYIGILVEANSLRSLRPLSPYKRYRAQSTPYQVVIDKLNRMDSRYQLQMNGEVYADWVIFEHFYLLLKPFLVNPDDWIDRYSLFREIQVFIDRSWRLIQASEPETVASYFKKIPAEQIELKE